MQTPQVVLDEEKSVLLRQLKESAELVDSLTVREYLLSSTHPYICRVYTHPYQVFFWEESTENFFWEESTEFVDPLTARDIFLSAMHP